MDAYTGFASVYDTFMDNVPYDEWCRYLVEIMKEYQVTEGLVAELGCGTGSMTRRLAAAGYDMIGIDLSEEMLDIARSYEAEYLEEAECEYDEAEAQEDEAVEKDESDESAGGFPRIMYLNQDMREFELYGTVAAMVSLCDSLNYITEEDELREVFRLVNNYLDPGGLFLFDMNTIHKYRDVIGDTTIAENREDCSFIWDNAYDEASGLNQYDVTIFKKVEFEEDEEIDTPLFERFTETHLQRAYSLETVIRLLQEAGMEFVAAYDAGTRQPVTEVTERMFLIAREAYQEGKWYQE
ncbi:MAG: class I SAM-dependent methyltransferase [Lachnospiraceae bacterium]|nr:class I SAM-dependent methyltransferase [Lachnospiraceae bacterium]